MLAEKEVDIEQLNERLGDAETQIQDLMNEQVKLTKVSKRVNLKFVLTRKMRSN